MFKTFFVLQVDATPSNLRHLATGLKGLTFSEDLSNISRAYLIKKFDPKSKILVTLRDPIERQVFSNIL